MNTENEVLVLGLMIQKDDEQRMSQSVVIDGIVGKFLGEEGRQRVVKGAELLFDEIGRQMTRHDPNTFFDILRSVLDE